MSFWDGFVKESSASRAGKVIAGRAGKFFGAGKMPEKAQRKGNAIMKGIEFLGGKDATRAAKDVAQKTFPKGKKLKDGRNPLRNLAGQKETEGRLFNAMADVGENKKAIKGMKETFDKRKRQAKGLMAMVKGKK